MHRQRRIRKAFTLVEMTIAMVAGAALLGGLSISLYVATQCAKPRDSDSTLAAVRSLQRCADELEFATKILDRSDKSIEFAVADRNGDGKDDSIRYQWSGIASDPLTRSFNGGSNSTIAEDIQEFSIGYRIRASEELWQVHQEGTEQVLLSKFWAVLVASWTVDSNDSIGQYVHPSMFAVTIPDGTRSWSLRKLKILAKASGSRDGNLWVQVRTADANHKPTSTVLAQQKLSETELDDSSYQWETIEFDEPATNISIFDGVCVVFSHADGGPAAKIIYDRYGNGNRIDSTNAEQTWDVSDEREMLLWLSGGLSELQDKKIERNYVIGATTELRFGGNKKTNRLSFQIPNCPELLEDSWRADFDSDPTLLDADFDGTQDWNYGPSGSFNTNELWHGTWKTSAASTLTTAQDSNFTTLTTIEYSCRDLDVDNGGVVVWVNADWDGSTYVPVIAELSLLSNGTQTLTLKTTENGADRILATVNEIPATLTTIRITIEPTLNVINLTVNQVEVATYDYVPQTAAHTNKRAGIMSVSSAFQFDFFSIRTAEAD